MRKAAKLARLRIDGQRSGRVAPVECTARVTERSLRDTPLRRGFRPGFLVCGPESHWRSDDRRTQCTVRSAPVQLAHSTQGPTTSRVWKLGEAAQVRNLDLRSPGGGEEPGQRD